MENLAEFNYLTTKNFVNIFNNNKFNRFLCYVVR